MARPVLRAPGAAPHLAQRGDGARERHADRRVEVADVDAELERVGGDDGEQVALRPAAARSRAAAWACSRRGRARSARRGRCGPASSSRWRVKRWISSTPRRDLRKQIVRISRSTSAASRFAASPSADARRPSFSSTSGGFHMAIWRSARGAPSRSTSSTSTPGEPLGELGRVRDRRAREEEARLGCRTRARAGAAGAGRSPRASRTRRGRRAPRRRRPRRGSRARRPTGGGSAARPRGACPGS